MFGVFSCFDLFCVCVGIVVLCVVVSFGLCCVLLFRLMCVFGVGVLVSVW